MCPFYLFIQKRESSIFYYHWIQESVVTIFLNLSSYCVMCLQGYGNKGITLYDIRAELSCRYKDLRVAYRVPNTEEVFNMLTKETPETFYIGNIHYIKI